MKKLGLTICALLCGLYLGACADTAIVEHNASLKLNGYLSEAKKIQLESIGYKVIVENQYNDPYYTVSWREV